MCSAQVSRLQGEAAALVRVTEPVQASQFGLEADRAGSRVRAPLVARRNPNSGRIVRLESVPGQ